MNARDDGGPAFPLPSGLYKGQPANLVDGSIGMTLRDYFAAKAMQEWVSGKVTMERLADGRPEFHADWVAKAAYAMADAMLKARQA